MTDFCATIDQLRIAMARANRVIMRLGGRPLPYPDWMRLPMPPRDCWW